MTDISVVHVVNSLESLLKSEKEEISASQKAKLTTALSKNSDILRALGTITDQISHNPVQHWTQLKDAFLYIRLLEGHQVPEDKNEIHEISERIQAAVEVCAKQAVPEWDSPLVGMEKILSSQSQASTSPPSLLNSYEPKQKVNPTLLAHIHAEMMILNSSYEGENNINLLKFLSDYVEDYLTRFPSSELQALLPLFKSGVENAIKSGLSESWQPDPLSKESKPEQLKRATEKFQSYFQESLTHLKPGESTLYPCGWRSEKGSHAMLALFTKTAEGEIETKVFNTGDGLDYHAMISKQGPCMVQPYIVIEKTPLQNLFNPAFTQAFFELNTMISDLSSRPTNYEASDTYQAFNHIGSPIRRCDNDGTKFIYPQLGGICAWAVLLALLHTFVKQDTYDHFVVSVGKDSLCAYYQENKAQLDQDPEALYVLKYSAILFSQQVLDAYQAGHISKIELQECHEMLKELVAEIEKAEKSYIYKLFPQSDFSLDGLDKLPQKFKDIYLWQQRQIPEANLSPSKDASAITPLSNFHWVKTPTGLVAGLPNFQEHLKECILSSNLTVATASLRNFFAELPFPDGLDDFLKDLNPEMANTLIGELSKLAFSFTAINQKSNTAQNFYEYISSIVYSHALLAFCVKIASRDPFAENYLKQGTLTSEDFLSLVGEAVMLNPTSFLSPDPLLRKLAGNAVAIFKEQRASAVKKHPLMCDLALIGRGSVEVASSLSALSRQEKQSEIGEMRYFSSQEFNDSPELREHLQKKKTDVENLGKPELVAELLADIEGSYLPLSIAGLRKLALTSTMTVYRVSSQGPLINEVVVKKVEKNRSSHIQAFINIGRIEEASSFECYLTLKARSLLKPALQLKEDSVFHNRISERAIFALPQKVDVEIANHELKELLSVATIGDHHKGQIQPYFQCVKALAYFQERIPQLSDDTFKGLFYAIFFKADFFEQVLTLNPDFRELFRQFVKDGWDYFSERGEMMAASYFLEIGMMGEKIIESAGFPSQLNAIKDRLQKILERPNSSGISDLEKKHFAKLYAAFVAIKGDELDVQGTTDLLKALFIHEAKMDNTYPAPYTVYMYKMASKMYKDAILQHVKGPQGEGVCNAIIALSGLKAQKWDTSQFPICLSSEGVRLDFTNFQTIIDNQTLVQIPQKFLDNTNFNQFFKSNGYAARYCATDHYQFSDERAIPTEVFYAKTGIYSTNLEIYQKIQGQSYRLVSTNKKDQQFLTNLNQSLGFHLSSLGTVWVSTEKQAPYKILLRDEQLATVLEIEVEKDPDHLNEEVTTTKEQREAIFKLFATPFAKIPADQKILHQYLLKHAREELLYLNPDPVRFRHVWIASKPPSLKPEEMERVTAFIQNSGEGLPPLEKAIWTFFREIAEKPQPMKILSVTKTDPKLGALQLVDIYHNSSSIPEAFKAGAMIWKKTDGEIALVEFSRYGLTFTLEKEKARPLNPSEKISLPLQLKCREFPGYHIATNQKFSGLVPFKGCLVLENDQGKRLLLVPRGHINAKPGSFQPKIDVSVDSAEEEKMLALPLDSKSKVDPKNKEQKLYYAYLLLGSKNYPEARRVLESTFSKIVPYKEDELKIIKKIAVLSRHLKDESPQAIAITWQSINLLLQSPLFKINDLDPIYWKGTVDQIRAFLGKVVAFPAFQQNMDEIRSALLKIAEFYADTKPEISNAAQRMATSIASQEGAKEFNVLQQLFEQIAKAMQKLNEKDKKGLRELPKSEFDALCTEIQSAQSTPCMITRPGKNAIFKWQEMYKKAREGTNLQEVALFLNYALKDPQVPYVILITLHAVLKEPELFPSAEEFAALLKPEEYSAFFHQIYTKLLKFSLPTEEESDSYEVSGIEVHNPRARKSDNLFEPAVLTDATQPVDQSVAIPPRTSFFTGKQLEQIFTLSENGGVQLSREELDELKQALIGKPCQQVLPVEAEAVSLQIENYWTNPARSEKWHYIPPEKLNLAATLLMSNHAERLKRIPLKQRELLKFANTLPDELIAKVLQELEVMGEKRHTVTLQDLYLFAARSDYLTVANKNPSLAAVERELIGKVLAYQDYVAETQQLQRALHNIKGLDVLDPESSVYKRLCEQVHYECTRKRPYDPVKEPQMLCLEVISEMGIFDYQYKDLKRLLSNDKDVNPNVVLHKFMGAGKTKLYLNLLALIMADGTHIPFVIVHPSQFDTTVNNLQAQSKQNFNQTPTTITYERSPDNTRDTLVKINELLEKVRKSRQYLIVTDKTIHNLYLESKELWKIYLEAKEPLSEVYDKIVELQKILHTFKTVGKAILDEADLLLNVRFETVYATGDAKSMSKLHCNTVADLYNTVTPIALKYAPYTRSRYDTLMKNEMIAAYLNDVVKKNHPALDQSLIEAYLNGTPEGENYYKGLTQKEQAIFAIAREEFDSILPLILSKRYGEHVGYSFDINEVLPKPYVSCGVPSPADFGFQYTLVNAVMHCLYHGGASPALVGRIVRDLQTKAYQEMKSDKSLKLQNTHAYKLFVKLCGDGELMVPFLKANQSDFEKIAQLYKNAPDKIKKFAKRYLFPHIKLHPAKIVSASYSLDSLFLEIKGFTGTPWNRATYPKRIEAIMDEQSAGKTIGVMWKNSRANDKKLSTSKFPECVDEIGEIVRKGGYNAFNDAGAIFNGPDNETVAKKFLSVLPEEIKAVVWFKNDALYVLERDRGDSIPYDRTHIVPENMFFIIDQGHGTGLDLPIIGKTLMTEGKTMKMRDREQSYDRDRKAAHGPRVEFLSFPEVDEHIRAELNLPEDQPITLAERLRLNEINQETELKEHMLMAAMSQVRHVVDTYLDKFRTNPGIDPKIVREKLSAAAALMAEETLDDPANDFGIKEDLPMKDFAEMVVEKTLEKMQPLFTCADLYPDLNRESVQKELSACFDFARLPEKVSSKPLSASDGLVQKQVMKETKQQKTNLTLKELMTEKSNLEGFNVLAPEWFWPDNVDTLSHKTYLPKTLKELGVARLPCERYPSSDKPNPDRPRSEGLVPILHMNELFANKSELEAYRGVFEIEASYNFIPAISLKKVGYFEGGGLARCLDYPFSPTQLPVERMLIIQAPGKPARLVLVDNYDAAFLAKKLRSQRDTSKSEDVKTYLVDSRLGVISSNTHAALDLNDTKIAQLMTQAKFFGGALIYTPQEKEYLKAWLLLKGAKKMEELFCQHILANKPKLREEYEGSTIQQVFSELTSFIRGS